MEFNGAEFKFCSVDRYFFCHFQTWKQPVEKETNGIINEKKKEDSNIVIFNPQSVIFFTKSSVFGLFA